MRISLMRISSGQQMPLTAFRGRIWGTALQKNSLKHSLTLFAQPKRLRKPQFWLNLTLQPKLWLRWNSFFYRWVSNLNLQFTSIFHFFFKLFSYVQEKRRLRCIPSTAEIHFSFFSSGQNGPGQLARWRICSSWLLTLTVVQGGMEWVMKTLEPMTQSRPMTVSPPRMEAPA